MRRRDASVQMSNQYHSQGQKCTMTRQCSKFWCKEDLTRELDIVGAEHSVKGEDLEGVITFMKGPFTNSAREGWTDEEKERWGKVIDEVVDEQKKPDGGVLAEMWAVIGTK